MEKFLREQLDKLLERRSTAKAELDQILVTPEAEKRGLNADEDKLFAEKRAAIQAIDTEIDEVRSKLADAEEDARRQSVVDGLRRSTEPAGTEGRSERPSGGAVVTSEPTVYRKSGRQSYFRDLVTVSMQRDGLRGATERLARNARELLVDAEKRALSTTDGAGAGGDFVPPLWMIDEYVTLARAARPIADRVRKLDLPGGTDSINLPKVLTGTAVAEQTTQNTPVQNTDMTEGAVNAAVATLAGQQVVSVQLIEQSPINMDEILLADLALDYATKVDIFVIRNNATGKLGLLNAGGTAQAYTDSSPTTGKTFAQIGKAIGTVQSTRFLPPDTVAMHPLRWAAFLSALDGASRPLIVPSAQGPNNAIAQATSNGSQGVVGNIAGVDVVVDASIPTNLGAGTNQDAIIVGRLQDSILWEGTPRSEAFRETKADQLSVLLRFYNYAAFMANRYTQSLVVIGGTGLVPPTFGS